MNQAGLQSSTMRFIGVLAAFAWAGNLSAAESKLAESTTVRATAAGFELGPNASFQEGSKVVSLVLNPPIAAPPFNQSAIKQSPEAARLGPDSRNPHFTVRFALPVPSDNATNVSGKLTGLDENVWAHNHSPGMEVLPNGDVLAIYFSAKTSAGASESDTTTRFVQARLRHGADQWDLPELFLDFEGMNDQSALLWREGDTIRFFGGGRGASHLMPFKMAVSTNNGVNWKLSLPQLDKPASDYTPQPIANAFRGLHDALYVAMDAAEDASFLWRSLDNGVHWSDAGGRTGARHSAIIPLNTPGKFLSIGGKNAGINGWTPMNESTDSGFTWSKSVPSPFPALGGNQRPSLIRLANGHLLFVTDSYHRNTKKSPEGWKGGEGCFVAISKDEGASWHFKKLPVALVHEKDRALGIGTLGYATARQAPNGVIHVLASMTHPCLHYEFNEAWIFSDVGDITPETSGGSLRKFRENYPDGSPRVTWSARVCPNGRYLLNGKQTAYYPNGKKQYEVNYASGQKTDAETYWNDYRTKSWSWDHNLRKGVSTWTHYWPNGKPKVESRWHTSAKARDSERVINGLEANGPAKQWNEKGELIYQVEFLHGLLKPGDPEGKNVAR